MPLFTQVISVKRNTYKLFATNVICVIRMISEKEGKARFGTSMGKEVFEELEKRRGLIARAKYIEYCLKQFFELQDNITELYNELLTTMPTNIAQEDCEKLRNACEKIQRKIAERKKQLLLK